MSLTIRPLVRLSALATGLAAVLPGGGWKPAERNCGHSAIALFLDREYGKVDRFGARRD